MIKQRRSKNRTKTSIRFLHFSLLSFLTFGVLFLALTLSPLALATDDNGTASDNSSVSLSVKEIISLRLLNDTASSEISQVYFDMTPTPNGVFEKKSFFAEAATSNPTGYKLYLTSSGKNHSGDYTNALINADSSIAEETSSVPSLVADSSVTEIDFSKNNSDYKNRWGYSTNGLNVQSETVDGATTNIITENTSGTNYNDIPENNVNRQIDNKSEATDHGLTPVTVGINVSSGLTSGIYMNTLELTAIANPLELDFSLNFDGNAPDTVTDLPEALTESSVAAQVSFTIPDTVPTREGYTFVKWNTEADGSGDSYNAGDTFTIVADDSSESGTSRTLYAVWEEKTYTYYIGYHCGTGTTNCPKSQTITSKETSIQYTIPSAKPTLSGYTFAEYTPSHGRQYNYASYQPGQTITINYGTYLRNEGAANEDNYLYLYAVNYSTFTLSGKSWAGPMKAYTQYSSAASYCPSGYRLPTLAEIRTLIGTSGDEYASETNSNVVSLNERLVTKGGLTTGDYWTSTSDTIYSDHFAILHVYGVKYTRTYSYGYDKLEYNGVLCTK